MVDYPSACDRPISGMRRGCDGDVLTESWRWHSALWIYRTSRQKHRHMLRRAVREKRRASMFTRIGNIVDLRCVCDRREAYFTECSWNVGLYCIDHQLVCYYFFHSQDGALQNTMIICSIATWCRKGVFLPSNSKNNLGFDLNLSREIIDISSDLMSTRNMHGIVVETRIIIHC